MWQTNPLPPQQVPIMQKQIIEIKVYNGFLRLLQFERIEYYLPRVPESPVHGASNAPQASAIIWNKNHFKKNLLDST